LFITSVLAIGNGDFLNIFRNFFVSELST